MTPHVVLVSSPGAGAELHWSHALAAAVASRAVALGGEVTWLAVVRAGQALGAAGEGLVRREFRLPPSPPLVHVAAATRHLQLETALAQTLRPAAPHRVVHVGVGAMGSPNVNWLADRLGAAAFAVVRAAEVVCARGDLVDREGHRCSMFLAPDRCRACVRTTWRRPAVADLAARSDLLAASLLASTAVFVPNDTDLRLLVEFGVPQRSLRIEHAADAIAVAAMAM